MKLSICKELSEGDSIESLLEVLNPVSPYEVSITFYDTSLNGEFEGDNVISVDFEDRNTVSTLALQRAVDQGCEASIFIPKNCTPFVDMVDSLFFPMINDSNITATYSDYSVNGLLVLQNNPISFCRRLEPGVENLYDLQQTKGIVKYIPLSLYNVKS